MLLDFRTLLVLNFIVNVINLVTMALLWRRYSARFQGLDWWLGAMAVHVIGIGMILMRGILPDVMLAVAANGVLMSSTILMLVGFQRFTGYVTSQRHNAVIFAAYLALLWYFHAVTPSLPDRNIANSALIAVIDIQTCWLLFRRVSGPMRRITFYVGLVMAGYVAVSIVRAGIILAYPHDAELFRSGLADSISITSYLGLHICLMISLTLTLTRRLMDEVQAQEERFAKAFHLAPYAMIIARSGTGHDAGRIVEVNDGFSQIFGYTRSEALGRTLPELGIPAQDGKVDLAPTGRGVRVEIQARRKSGEKMIGQLASDGLVVNGTDCVLITLSDITEESRLKARLQELASKDALTGLPNRRLFFEQFEFARQNADRHGTRMAVLSIDLDRFKAVNDGFGHAAGDLVLMEAARRLAGCLRKMDVVSRFGGDEFVILLSEIRDKSDAELVTRKIVTSFRTPFDVQGQAMEVTASVGLAVYPDDGGDVEALLNSSDKAMYRAKHGGRDGYNVSG